jgi:hypothetical protein
MNAVSASLTAPESGPIQLEFFPGRACVPPGEACHDSEYSENETESPGRCIGRHHPETEHQVNRRDPAEEAPTGREAHRGETQKRRNEAGRESEVAIVPLKLGITGPRGGPLLSSSERNRESLPDCPLQPGTVTAPLHFIDQATVAATCFYRDR